MFLLQELEQQEILYYTDFEAINISNLKNKTEQDMSTVIENENIVYIRFIKKSVFENYFNDEHIDKNFFLPTHKESEFHGYLRTFSQENQLESVPDIYLEYFPEEIKSQLKQEWFTTNAVVRIVPPDNLDKVSTSMYILYKEKNLFDTSNIIQEADLKEVDNPEELLLQSGLKVCELIPMEKMFVAYGYIRDLENCLLSLDYRRPGYHLDQPLTEVSCVEVPPIVSDSSHVGLFKKDKVVSHVTFADIAHSFKLLSKEQYYKKPKKKKKRERREKITR